MKTVSVFPISYIEPVFKNGVRIYQKNKDVVLNSIDDLEKENKLTKNIISKEPEMALGILLLYLDIVREKLPEIKGDYDKEAQYISKTLGVVCSHSQVKTATLSKFFKRKAKRKAERTPLKRSNDKCR